MRSKVCVCVCVVVCVCVCVPFMRCIADMSAVCLKEVCMCVYV